MKKQEESLSVRKTLTFRLYLCSSDYAVGILMIENEKER